LSTLAFFLEKLPFARTSRHCFTYLPLDESEILVPSAVRAGTGGDEAAIWTGDLVGTCFP